MLTPNFTNMSRLLLCTRSNCLDKQCSLPWRHGKLRQLADYDGATEIEMRYYNNPGKNRHNATHTSFPPLWRCLAAEAAVTAVWPLSSNSSALQLCHRTLSRNGLSLPVIVYVCHCLLNMSTRCSYTASEKLTIIRYAEAHDNRAASREYDGMSESNVRLCIKMQLVSYTWLS